MDELYPVSWVRIVLRLSGYSWYPSPMESFRDLIAGYGLSEFAADIGVQENTAKQMRKRDSVAPEYWDAWVLGALAKGHEGITYERLAKIAAARRADNRTLPEAEVA